MSGLSDFRTFFGSFVAIISAGVATTALVLVTYLANLAPPWPVAITEITAIGQLIILIFIYQFLKRASRKKVNRFMIRAAILFGVFFLAYASLFSLLIYNVNDVERGVRGFVCTDNARLVFGEACPFLSRGQIADAESEPDVLWTALGLLAGRMSLLVSWVGLFSSVVAMVASFVVYQRRRGN